jgi:hypothetical protein
MSTLRNLASPSRVTRPLDAIDDRYQLIDLAVLTYSTDTLGKTELLLGKEAANRLHVARFQDSDGEEHR